MYLTLVLFQFVAAFQSTCRGGRVGAKRRQLPVLTFRPRTAFWRFVGDCGPRMGGITTFSHAKNADWGPSSGDTETKMCIF